VVKSEAVPFYSTRLPKPHYLLKGNLVLEAAYGDVLVPSTPTALTSVIE
jgi:hypothetical protein